MLCKNYIVTVFRYKDSKTYNYWGRSNYLSVYRQIKKMFYVGILATGGNSLLEGFMFFVSMFHTVILMLPVSLVLLSCI